MPKIHLDKVNYILDLEQSRTLREDKDTKPKIIIGPDCPVFALTCCDCFLTHIFYIERLKDGTIELTMEQNKEATEYYRNKGTTGEEASEMIFE